MTPPAEATILLPLLENSVFVSTSPGGPNKMTHPSDLLLEPVGKLSDYSDSTNQARVLIDGAARPSVLREDNSETSVIAPIT